MSGSDVPAIPWLDLSGPPEHLRAVLALPGVSGAGYLDRSRDKEWRGAIQADLGPVAVLGLGIVTSGDDPAFLLLLAATFNPAIQLSFGFTLLGVGGIVGINRRPDYERITSALRATDLSRLLFPSDAVRDADEILGVLEPCFPYQKDAFVVGPTMQIGWGGMVSATIAVLATDRDVAILGRVAVGLPSTDLPLVRLEAVVLGRVDASGLAIDASLVNSYISGIPVDGDIRLRMRLSGDSLFALSAGGFHPAFPIPAGMASMRRMGTHLSFLGIIDLRLEAYLAITTGSVQFGARIDLYAGFGGFEVRGHAAFDAFFTFDPFHFEAAFVASVSIGFDGFDITSVALRGHLSGPSPWRIRGQATVSVLFIDVDVDLPPMTLGEESAAALPPARDPMAVLVHELGRVENWTAASGEVPALVRLVPGAGAGGAVLHPLSDVAFRQSAVPMEETLTRMDGIVLHDPVKLHIRDATPCGEPLRPGESCVMDHKAPFIPRQFCDPGPGGEVSVSGFRSLPAGFRVRMDVSFGAPVLRDEGYEMWVAQDGQTRRLVTAPAGWAPPFVRRDVPPASPHGPMVVLASREPRR